MKVDWVDFWDSFLEKNKLNSKLNEIELVSHSSFIDVCHEIYDKYNYDELNEKRKALIEEVEKFPGVHLNTSRVKEIDSVLKKIITKRYAWMMDPNSRYSKLNSDNFDKVLTDLIGIRFILSYSGDWKDVHNAITERFPYLDGVEYEDDLLIPARQDMDFLAELPHAYYADGDDTHIYEGERIIAKLRESGYRSVHYVVCFKGVYAEIQVRTIYDEAWSDCNHNYVYKHEENASYPALLELSNILCLYTNTCSELGELMRTVYNDKGIVERDKYFYTTEEMVLQIDKLVDRYSEAQNLIMQFKKDLYVEGDRENE